ncbi:MAG: 4-alpha-glucanotransferase [Deltaproteobacteria bacterium]|nr:4-alpha-glucanotransferase [Deltaproteobacteria bacterium]
MNFSEKVESIANAMGIIPRYYDLCGNQHVATIEQKCAILNAMGVATDGEEAIDKSIKQLLQKKIELPVSPVVTVDEDHPVMIPVDLLSPHSPPLPIEWTLKEEFGRETYGKFEASTHFKPERFIFLNREFYRYRFQVSEGLKPGYHSLHLKFANKKDIKIQLIVSPQAAFHDVPRCWGLMVQLYGIRSLKNWGIGDFEDLKDLCFLASRFGAGFVGLSPLYALYTDNPKHISPYSPSTRRFLNPWYIRPERTEREEILSELRNSKLVDYERVVPLKIAALRKQFESFVENHLLRGTKQSEEFRLYTDFRGESLKKFATFEAQLSGSISEREILFHQYLQFLTEKQLQDAQTFAKSMNPPIRIYLDVPVGVDSAGFDVWYEPDLYAKTARIGAPPDDFNPNGQEWGVVPFIPHQLISQKYRTFIDILRRAMQLADIVRLDHVMGLLRLFWIPDGYNPKSGVYVRYPFLDLMRIVNLESVRNNCAVVGEDLGTVPEIVRSEMAARKLFSCKVLYFEKKPDGTFKSPREYPEYSIASINTHDLPTFAAYWQKKDIQLRKQLGLLAHPNMEVTLRETRRKDKANLLKLLRDEGLLDDKRNVPLTILLPAVLKFMARTKSRLVGYQVEDFILQEDQPNVPGTTTQYPSWKIRWKKSMESLEKNHEIVRLTSFLNRNPVMLP